MIDGFTHYFQKAGKLTVLRYLNFVIVKHRKELLNYYYQIKIFYNFKVLIYIKIQLKDFSLSINMKFNKVYFQLREIKIQKYY